MAAAKLANGGSITADDTYELGGAGQMSGKIVIQTTKVSGYDGAVTVKARLTGSTQAYQPIPYVRRNLGGSVSDDTVVSATLADGLIEINANGLDIALVSSGRTTGSLLVNYKKVLTAS